MTRSRRGVGVGLVALVAAATALGAGRVAAGTASACDDIGDESPVVDGFPERMSSLVGADIRTGAHECYERVVIEFTGTGEVPGYAVRYETGELTESPSGLPVEIAGDAALIISFGAWMPDMEGTGYAGPTQIVPGNVAHIEELRQIENFEGQSQWAIGLDRQRGFRVSTLSDPVRLVIDIETDTPEPPPVTTAAPETTTPPATAAPSSAATTAPAPAPPATTVVELPTMADHPLVGAWVLVDETDPDAPPVLVVYHADGTSQQSDGTGSGYGSWQPTTSTSALAATVWWSFEPVTTTTLSTYRAQIEVSDDGSVFDAVYTVELAGEGAPVGEYGPGRWTATRLEPGTPGAPVGSLDDLRTLLLRDDRMTTTTTG